MKICPYKANLETLSIGKAELALKSTKTTKFNDTFLDRALNVGIAEQNAAGLATCGKIPFISTYAVFGSMRMCEQIRTSVCYLNLNVKMAVSHGGLIAGSALLIRQLKTSVL